MTKIFKILFSEQQMFFNSFTPVSRVWGVHFQREICIDFIHWGITTVSVTEFGVGRFPPYGGRNVQLTIANDLEPRALVCIVEVS